MTGTLTILFPCRQCGEKHALACMVSKRQKRTLGLFCGNDGGEPKFVPLPATVLETMDESDPDLLRIPTHYTPEARKENEAKGNYGLPLMNLRPGERRDERPVFVGDEPLAPYAEAATEIKRLKTKLAQIKQAHAELEEQIKALVTKRIGLESQERDTRKQLRVLWTEPLNLAAPEGKANNREAALASEDAEIRQVPGNERAAKDLT